jgi:hypothetical protein
LHHHISSKQTDLALLSRRHPSGPAVMRNPQFGCATQWFALSEQSTQQP